MSAWVGLVFCTGAFPLWRMWRVLRRTSLRYAVYWSLAGWLAWGMVILADELGLTGSLGVMRYLALALTGCAGVAVLGARWPGAAAWNLVVAGLLAVLLLPLAEGFLTGTVIPSGGVRLWFLGVLVGVGIVNYLPTRQAPAALLVALCCASEGAALTTAATPPATLPIAELGLALVPWLAWTLARRGPAAVSEVDHVWLEFRDRFGLVWAQRLREQFNHAATHAGWPLLLRWHGFQTRAGAPSVDADEVRTTLFALMKRFGARADQ